MKTSRTSTPPCDISVGELEGASPKASEAYAAIQQQIARQGSDHLRHVATQAQILMRDLGVTFGLYDAEDAHDHVVSFDTFPRVIDPDSWKKMAEGIQQRTRVWNAFFRDIYDTQEVLKAGVIPFEVIYSDSGYQRPAVGLTMPEDIWVHCAAYDLARTAKDQWMVIQDHVATTTGASYALQARHVLGQVSPALLGTSDVLPAHEYPTMLLEHLRRFARNPSSHSRVVLLSPGHYNRAYYEHSFLARQMGIPLVRGSDLIVLNSQVFLKTIGGLEPIDVIYRRITEPWIDPVTFRGDSIIGVPGLMSCVRRGSVTVANAIGTGLGNNRGIASYLPKLARFYLNENLLLPTVPRLLCQDTDQRELVLANLKDYFISHISDRANNLSWQGDRLSRRELADLRQKILAHPGQYVAEPRLPLNLMPVASAGDPIKRHAGLRVFSLGGRRGFVPPLALTRCAREANSPLISTGMGGGIKDTWILRNPDEPPRDQAITVASPQRRLHLSSRIADSLYWLGRYAERAENTTRILKVLRLAEMGDPSRQGSKEWSPLWEALARATGHPSHFFRKPMLPRRQSVSHYLLLDTRNPSSVIRCLDACRENARTIRESIPPEVWVVINRLHRIAREEGGRHAGDASPHTSADVPIEFQDIILDQLDCLTGASSKNMLRDDGWHFWSMGTHLERALTTVMVMREVFLKRQINGGKSPRRDDSHLDALLRMLSCQYAYRSLFQSRPAMHNAARMLLQDEQLPRSVLYCLENIRRSLKAAFGARPVLGADHQDPSPLRHCMQFIGEIEFMDLAPYFEDQPGTRSPRLRHWLDKTATRLMKLSSLISDHYLEHQAFNILR